jgi:hypothetical protein
VAGGDGTVALAASVLAGTTTVPAGGTLVVEWTPGDSPSLREVP